MTLPENKQPKSHITNTFIVPIHPGKYHIFTQYFEVMVDLVALVSIRISQEYNFAEYASRCYLCQVEVMACL